jgi:hypothetical protein
VLTGSCCTGLKRRRCSGAREARPGTHSNACLVAHLRRGSRARTRAKTRARARCDVDARGGGRRTADGGRRAERRRWSSQPTETPPPVAPPAGPGQSNPTAPSSARTGCTATCPPTPVLLLLRLPWAPLLEAPATRHKLDHRQWRLRDSLQRQHDPARSLHILLHPSGPSGPARLATPPLRIARPSKGVPVTQRGGGSACFRSYEARGGSITSSERRRHRPRGMTRAAAAAQWRWRSGRPQQT